jgi:hypothetical protein
MSSILAVRYHESCIAPIVRPFPMLSVFLKRSSSHALICPSASRKCASSLTKSLCLLEWLGSRDRARQTVWSSGYWSVPKTRLTQLESTESGERIRRTKSQLSSPSAMPVTMFWPGRMEPPHQSPAGLPRNPELPVNPAVRATGACEPPAGASSAVRWP